MGIHKECARFIILEHKYRPIQGRVLTLGRQDVHFNYHEALELFEQENVKPVRIKRFDNLDLSHEAQCEQTLNDHDFFSLFGLTSPVESLDVRDIEGATILHDLGVPIPHELEGQFDIIYNGSVFDNLFDPVTAIKNVSKLLKPGGRVLHIEHASNATNSAYLQFSPSWFSDYYIMNKYLDCKAYLATFEYVDGPWEYFACPPDRTGNIEPFANGKNTLVLAIAEKADVSTWDKNPIQGVYRDPTNWQKFLHQLDKMEMSKRPYLRALPRHDEEDAPPTQPYIALNIEQ